MSVICLHFNHQSFTECVHFVILSYAVGGWYNWLHLYVCPCAMSHPSSLNCFILTFIFFACRSMGKNRNQLIELSKTRIKVISISLLDSVQQLFFFIYHEHSKHLLQIMTHCTEFFPRWIWIKLPVPVFIHLFVPQDLNPEYTNHV